jgi:hypothetical protein
MQTALATSPNSGIPTGARRAKDALDATPRTLYVRRNLTNAADLVAWAKANGIAKTLPPGDMHVTLAHSKEPVDWSDVGEAPDAVAVPVQGERAVENLGDKGAVVLRFGSDDFQDRWRSLCAIGAKWDFPSYKPHVTITYDAGGADISAIPPYDGPLEFGPEILEEVDEGWADKVKKALVPTGATDSALRLALDRESVREMDRDGRLRVAVANISKANICPYRGSEIPGADELGLDPEKVYQLFRDPEELKKAAPSFNGVQILRKHIPVSAEDHQPWDVVGATGTDAKFVDPYLQNSLSIWERGAIDGIESEEKRELSCGYHYVPIMETGTYNGKHFDGRMTQIVGNHVALVEDGRAGSDVVVGDSADEILWAMIERELLAISADA